jgi:PPOX class probable F420-dependent enzyme
MTPDQRREFVRQHRTCIFGYNRKAHGPAMTIVYYVMDGDDILVSTMAARQKTKAVARNGKVSLCVLDEEWPPTYLQVYCDGTIETDEEVVVDVMMRIAGVMAGKPMPEAVRSMVREGARRERRIVLRMTPYATFHTPPRHVSEASDIAGLTHETSASIAWNA